MANSCILGDYLTVISRHIGHELFSGDFFVRDIFLYPPLSEGRVMKRNSSLLCTNEVWAKAYGRKC
jgi:hypothetical protein